MEWLAPTAASILAAAVAILTVILNIRGKKTEVAAGKSATEPESWDETVRARRAWFFIEDLFHQVRGGWKGYARRVQEGGDPALTDAEKATLALEPPTFDRASH